MSKKNRPTVEIQPSGTTPSILVGLPLGEQAQTGSPAAERCSDVPPAAPLPRWSVCVKYCEERIVEAVNEEEAFKAYKRAVGMLDTTFRPDIKRVEG